jgi:hypothetical protein
VKFFGFSGFPAGAAGDSAQPRALAGGDDRAPGGQGHGRPARSRHGLDAMAFDGPAADPGGGFLGASSRPAASGLGQGYRPLPWFRQPVNHPPSVGRGDDDVGADRPEGGEGHRFKSSARFDFAAAADDLTQVLFQDQAIFLHPPENVSPSGALPFDQGDVFDRPGRGCASALLGLEKGDGDFLVAGRKLVIQAGFGCSGPGGRIVSGGKGGLGRNLACQRQGGGHAEF